MQKPELLSPAGNMDALKAAIHNGADAIYISGKNFGARKFADNFDNKSLIEAINYAHLYDVKIYVTTNTLIYENEVEDFISYLKFLYLNGVDAVIMQDIGMMSLARKIVPNLEIHASTQGNNCNDDTLKLYNELGVSRVVLARELSLEQINGLKTNIEKEVFIHGALCICYSGCCLFSSLNGGRSGNRGECAGPCRLPYTLIKNNKIVKTNGNFLLSTKELNTTKHIKEILKSNIQSLKIEGRMKSPEYVGFVTKMYRNLIDDITLDKDYDKNLKKLFNREFTNGHLFKSKEHELMNQESPNHQGIKIGNVISTNKQIKIKLTDDLNQNDGIRFKESNKGMIINKLYNEKGLLINRANNNDIVYLDNKINLKSNDTVLKTIDHNLQENLKKYELKKLLIDIDIQALIGKPLSITFKDQKNTVFIQGNIVEKSITSPIPEDQIKKQISKLGNTPFTANKISITMDSNIFISIKELNDLRRTLTEKLINKKIKINRQLPEINITKEQIKCNQKININAYITNEEQLTTILNKVDTIYTDNYQLYSKYKNENIYYKTNRTSTNLQDFNNENLLLTNLGDVYKYSKNNNCQADYTLNIINSYSSKFLNNQNIKTITLSPEMSLTDIKNIATYSNNLEVIVYGTIELMVMNHCIIKTNDGCHNCKNDKYYLKNNQNKLFPIITKNCQTHIMHHEKINLLKNINTLKELGITNFRLEFFDESKEQILNIINQIKSVKF